MLLSRLHTYTRSVPATQLLPPPQTLAPPPPQTSPVGQLMPLLQSITLPQPSVAMPQLKPCWAHVVGTHVVPQTPFCGFAPPPHTWFAGQLPQSMVLPQVSPCMPHS